MAEKFKEQAIIIRQEEIADDIYSMWLRTEEIAAHAKAGQFVSVYCNEGSRLLPRPISICEIDKKDNAIRLVYRKVGKGTEEFSGMHTGGILNIYACGPKPMLAAIKEYAKEKQIECWISMEERMACGIGACLACVCQSKDKDEHSNVNNKRVCKEGPVFRAEEVEL